MPVTRNAPRRRPRNVRRPRRRNLRRRRPTTVRKRYTGIQFPLGNRMFTQLTYNEVVSQTGATLATYTFRGNSLFDPNYTGAGNQPLGFDEISAFYQKYRVFASKIVAKYIPTGTPPTRIVVKPSNVVTTPATLDAAASTGGAKSRDVMPAASTSRPVVIKHFRTTAQILGVSKSAVMDEDFAALVSASPSHTWLWQLTAGSLDGITNVSGYWDVRITYYCEFYDRNNLAMS